MAVAIEKIGTSVSFCILDSQPLIARNGCECILSPTFLEFIKNKKTLLDDRSEINKGEATKQLPISQESYGDYITEKFRLDYAVDPEIANRNFHLAAKTWNPSLIHILSEVLCSEFDLDQIKVFYSQVQRETHFGSAIFALHDAVAFLVKQPELFKMMRCDPPQYLLLDHHHIPIYPIIDLPAEYMVGTQSYRLINEYLRNPIHEESDPILKGSHRSEELLDAFIKRHSVQNNDGKLINLYVQRKLIKCFNRLINFLINTPSKEIRDVITQVLV